MTKRSEFDLRSDEDVVFHLAHHKPQRPAFRIRGPEGISNSPSEILGPPGVTKV
jgi:hypothetical protein